MAKRWRKEDDNYFKRYAKKRTLDELTKRFKTEADVVLARLNELKLKTKDGQGFQEPWVDPALEDFEAGLKAYHANKLPAAAKLFQKAVEATDQTDLKSRVRVYIDLCERVQAKEEGIDDPFLEAVAAKNRGELDAVLEICARGGRRAKDERFAYLAASVQALAGERDEALDLLKQAIEMEPENRVHAFHDSDFDSLRADDEFQALFEVT